MTRFLIAASAFAVLAACDAPQQANVAAINSVEADSNASQARPAGLSEPVTDRARAQSLMRERHDGMEEIGDSMKLVSRELKGDAPDLAKVRSGAAKIAELAPKAAGWFPPGTGPDVGKTEAKAEIWQKPEDFAAKSKAFGEVAAKFNAAAQGSDLAAIRAAHGDLGKSCKACHDLYREEH